MQSEECPSPLRLACCARGRVVLCRIRERPLTPLLRCARPHRCAWLCCARKNAVCIVVEETPVSGPVLSLFLWVLFAHVQALRNIH
jgi:hypothetical protein